MSTNFHVPIVTGAAANAAIVNAPLGALDAAIAAETAEEAAARAAAITAEAAARVNADTVEAAARVNADAAEAATRANADAAEAAARAAGDELLDTRMDNLVVGAGTSPAETVDARAAGNVGSPATVLAERIEWLEGANNVHAAAFGLGSANTAAANTTAINAATAAAGALGAPAVVILPAGWYDINPFTVPANICIRGAKMPVLNRGAGVLATGTIFRGTGVVAGGTLVQLSARSGLMDLGVDVSAYATAKNAIAGLAASDDCILLNVAALGNGYMHGVVMTESLRTLVNNYTAAFFEHGLVFKSSHNMASNLKMWNCSISALTLTSDGGFDVVGNVISNLHSDGTAVGEAGGIRVYTGGASATDVVGNLIDNFYIHNAGIGIYVVGELSTGRRCQFNRFANGFIQLTTSNGVWIDAADDGANNGADYNDFSNITVDSPGTVGFNNQYGGVHNSLHGCRVNAPGAITASPPTFGVWQKIDIGFGGMSTLVLCLHKSVATSIPTGAAWVDVPWDLETLDNNGMHATGSAIFDTAPAGGLLYRLRAVLCFAANATGIRRVGFLRSLSGAPYQQVGPNQIVTIASATDECQVVLEYMTPFNPSYAFKVAVQQTSGGALDITNNSHLTVELVR